MCSPDPRFLISKLSTQKIMDKLNWLTAYQIIIKESVLFIHKVVFNNQPKAITDLITFSLNNSQNIRQVRKPIVIEDHKSLKAKKSIIYLGIFLYNKLPTDIVLKNPKCLSHYLQENMHNFYNFDKILKYDPG